MVMKMSDLIDRQAAIAFVDCGYLRPPTELAWSDKDVVDMLKRVPSAQPEIIRCKDCENLQTDWKPLLLDRHYCGVMDSMMKEDDFCSYAERRQND